MELFDEDVEEDEEEDESHVKGGHKRKTLSNYINYILFKLIFNINLFIIFKFKIE